MTYSVVGGVLSCCLPGCGAKQEENQRVVKQLEEARASAVDAQKEIEQLKQKLHLIEQERVGREALKVEERRRLERAQQVGARELTPQQWWPILKTKSMAEVKELLGSPDSSSDEDRQWWYYFKAIAPNSGVKDSLVVYFRAGRVAGVRGQFSDVIIQD